MAGVSRVDPSLELAVRQLAAPPTSDGRRLWSRPSIDPAQAVLRYREATKSATSGGTIGDCAAEQMQYDWMVAIQRGITLMGRPPEWWEEQRAAERTADEDVTGPWYAYLEEFRSAVTKAHASPAS